MNNEKEHPQNLEERSRKYGIQVTTDGQNFKIFVLSMVSNILFSSTFWGHLHCNSFNAEIPNCLIATTWNVDDGAKRCSNYIHERLLDSY